jgi:hypothetical protein
LQSTRASSEKPGEFSCQEFSMSSPRSQPDWTVSLSLIGVGVLLMLWSLDALLAPEPTLSMSSPGWFEARSAHGKAFAFGMFKLFGGGFLAVVGLLISPKARAANLRNAEEAAAAIARGMRRGLMDPPGEKERR